MALLPDDSVDDASEGVAAVGDDVDIKSESPCNGVHVSDVSVSDVSFETLIGLRLSDEIAQNQLNSLAPLSLAYIGDAVFELYVRSRLLIPAKRIRDYHQQVVGQVKAEQQSCYVDVLRPHLTEAEQDILRRGRNATTGRNRRAKGADYQKATGLEALIGFLYLSDPARLMTLLSKLEIA